MQISEQKFLQMSPPQDFIAGLSGHADGVSLVLGSEKWKKIEFENDRG